MVRTLYDQQLQELQDKLLLMGSMVTQAIHDSVEALKTGDLDTAHRLIADDALINAKRFEIEDETLMLIATQQPMARDMRLLAAVLEIAGELERIGDYAKGIGRIIYYMGGKAPFKPLVKIPIMAEKALDMLRRSLDAFVHRDLEAARQIPTEDDEIDALYNQIYAELLDIIVKQPELAEHANYLMWAGHNFERAADRVTNICERIIYTITGKLVEMDATEPDMTGLH